MNKKLVITSFIVVAVFGYLYLTTTSKKSAFNFSPTAPSQKQSSNPVNVALAAEFDYLSRNGNSSCSAAFRDSIVSKPDDARLQGSCCSPMNIHRYKEQVEGLKKYSNIPEIPPDPYNIEAKMAKMMMSHYDDTLTLKGQKAYDYAMANSMEKGPCCCKCWRWNAYGGLAKILITQYHFTGEQITDVWNLSDGCGGDSNEHHH